MSQVKAKCQNVLEQDTEPQVAPDGLASTLHDSSAAIAVCERVCERVNDRRKNDKSSLSNHVKKSYIYVVHLQLMRRVSFQHPV